MKSNCIFDRLMFRKYSIIRLRFPPECSTPAIIAILIIFGLYKIYKLHKRRIEEEKEHIQVLSKLNGLVMSSHLRMMEKVHKSAREKLEELKEKEKKDN